MSCVLNRSSAWLTLSFLILIHCKAISAFAEPSEEVRFSSDTDTVIAATLQKPPGVKSPVPVAIIITGTGPWTRGGLVKIRARLIASGIATLEYDKRGLGQSTGTFVDTLPVMEHDVAAAVTFLRRRKDVNGRRIRPRRF